MKSKRYKEIVLKEKPEDNFDAYDVFHEKKFIGRVNVLTNASMQVVFMRARMLYPQRMLNLKFEDLEFRFMGHHKMRNAFSEEDMKEFKKIEPEKIQIFRKLLPASQCNTLAELVENRHLSPELVQAIRELTETVKVVKIGKMIKGSKEMPIIVINPDFSVQWFINSAEYGRKHHVDGNGARQCQHKNDAAIRKGLKNTRFHLYRNSLVISGENDLWQFAYFLVKTQGWSRMCSFYRRIDKLLLINSDFSEYSLCKSKDEIASLLGCTIGGVGGALNKNRMRICDGSALVKVRGFFIIDAYDNWKDDIPKFRALHNLQTSGDIRLVKQQIINK